MSLENFFFYIILPFLLFMTGMISFFIFNTRKRKNVHFPSASLKDEIIIDCSFDLKKNFAFYKRFIKLVPFVTPLFIYFFVMFFILIGEGPEALTILRDPNSTIFKIAFFLPVLIIIGTLLGYYTRKNSIDNYMKAISLSEDKKLIFKLNHDGITIPTLLLTNPALWRATEKNLIEIFVPFTDIDTIEVWNGAGNSPNQYKINAHEPSAQWGLAGLGLKMQLGIGIKRNPLHKSENDILNFFRAKLGDRLHIHIDIDNSSVLNK